METPELFTVFAHAWLNMTSIIEGSAETLLRNHHVLSDVQRSELLGMMISQTHALEDSLISVFAAARPSLRVALQELQRDVE